MKEKNLNAMLKGVGFDVFIICTSNESQAIYWQERLETVKGDVIPEGATVLAVDEDWEGGAGNALGTFYAYEKACAKAAAMGIKDIHARLQAGAISIGMYHTAGKGTRLAPLPGAENNNKPGVKLPALLKVGKTMRPMTILESVIRQTGVYASSRKGRLSVFWGDQIFIPSVATEYVPKHHIDILCFLGPLPHPLWTVHPPSPDARFPPIPLPLFLLPLIFAAPLLPAPLHSTGGARGRPACRRLC